MAAYNKLESEMFLFTGNGLGADEIQLFFKIFAVLLQSIGEI